MPGNALFIKLFIYFIFTDYGKSVFWLTLVDTGGNSINTKTKINTFEWQPTDWNGEPYPHDPDEPGEYEVRYWHIIRWNVFFS